MTPTESSSPGRGQDASRACAMCSACPVRQQCLEHALEVDAEFGVWGGLSRAERLKLERGQRRRRPADEARSIA